MTRLSVRQKRFARNIAAGMIQRAAAIEAGYSETSADSKASQLAENGKVLERIAELEAPAIEKTGADAEFITQELLRDYHQAMKGNPVLGRYGKPMGQQVVNLSGALRALELLGERRGVSMFVDSKNVTHRDEFLNLTPERRNELIKLLESELERRGADRLTIH